MGLFSKLFSSTNDKQLKKLSHTADKIISLLPNYSKKTDDELRRCTTAFKERLSKGETLDDILVEAYAVCTEAVKRVLGFDLYKVQIMGAIALHQGRIAEMLTGEGKTVVETLPAYLNALAEKGVHVVTVNDYLADRDAGWMGGVYRFLGLTVGLIKPFQSTEEKQEAYKCDITYGTNTEFGFDYLRDNMQNSFANVCQRGLSFAIVDEVDSILIDEAKTPLIIAGQVASEVILYQACDAFAKSLVRSTYVPKKDDNANYLDADGDFVVDEENDSISLTTRGIEKAEKFFKVKFSMPVDENANTETDETESEDIDENADEIEESADETVDETDETETVPERKEDPEQTRELYDAVINLYKHIRFAVKANFLMKKDKDYVVMDGEVLIVDEYTGRLMFGRRYNEGLHQAIEAKEGVKIQGESKTFASVTFQNYFRLYNKLSGMTGTAKLEEQEFLEIYGVDVVCIPPNKEVKRIDEEDRVYVTQKAKLDAIVQDISDCYHKGQPVLVGTPTVEKSEELSVLLGLAGVPHLLLNAKNHREEAMIIAQAGRFGSITVATNMAGRGTDIILGGNASFYAVKNLENQGFDPETIDKALHTAKLELTPEMAEIVDKYQQERAKIAEELASERDKVIECGGLRVIGTEKNENRRIDAQLRGRSGRQGDEGSSVFYLSFEDDLLRIPYEDELNKYIVSNELHADSLVQNSFIAHKIKNAQTDLEQRNYSIRKNVLSYDDVLNNQRETIYQERRNIMASTDVHEKILSYIPDYVSEVIQKIIDFRYDYRTWNYDKLNEIINQELNIPGKKVLTIGLAAEMTIDRIIDEFLDATLKTYNEKYEAFANAGQNFGEVEKNVLLSSIDAEWINQMDNMDNLRSCVGLKALGQVNPVVNYQIEGRKFFDEMIENIKRKTVQTLLKADLGAINQDIEEMESYPDEILDN